MTTAEAPSLPPHPAPPHPHLSPSPLITPPHPPLYHHLLLRKALCRCLTRCCFLGLDENSKRGEREGGRGGGGGEGRERERHGAAGRAAVQVAGGLAAGSALRPRRHQGLHRPLARRHRPGVWGVGVCVCVRNRPGVCLCCACCACVCYACVRVLRLRAPCACARACAIDPVYTSVCVIESNKELHVCARAAHS
jgi:hypothetical protein